MRSDNLTSADKVPAWVIREDVPSPATCRHGVGLPDYCPTCEDDWHRTWTPEDQRDLDSGAWLGLAFLALVAVVAFVAGYWMGGMR